MSKWLLSSLLFSAVHLVACGGTHDESTEASEVDDEDASEVDDEGTSNDDEGDSGPTDCDGNCIAHEEACGSSTAESDCRSICDRYEPLAWQVECAEAAPCGDDAALVACMPDPECEARCAAHEEACGDPDPSETCAEICETNRPTPSQVECAEEAACGDFAALDECMAPP